MAMAQVWSSCSNRGCTSRLVDTSPTTHRLRQSAGHGRRRVDVGSG